MGVVIWGRKEKEAEMKEAEMKEVEMKKGGTREIGGKGGARTAVETVERVVVEVEDDFVRPPTDTMLSVDLAEDDFVRPHKIFSTKTKIKVPDDDLDMMSHDNFFKKSRTCWMDTMTTDNFISYRNSASPKRRHLEETVQEVIQETVVETVQVVEEAKPSKKEKEKKEVVQETVVETVKVVEEVVEEAKPSKKEKEKKEPAKSAEPEEEQPKHAKKEKKEKKTK